MGLRVKLFLVWLILLLAPLAILGGVGYIYISSQLSKEIIHHQAEVGELISREVDAEFSKLRQLTQLSTGLPRLNALLSQDTLNPAQRVEAETILLGMIDISEIFIHYYLIKDTNFSDPLVSLSDPEITSIPSVDTTQLSALLNTDNSVMFLPETDSAASTKILRGYFAAMMPIRYTSPEEVDGYIVALISPQRILNILELQADGDSTPVITDAAGNIILKHPGLNISKTPSAQTFQKDAIDGFIPRYKTGDDSYMVRMNPLTNNFWLVTLVDNHKIFEKQLPYIVIFAMTMSLTLLASGVVFNLIINNIAIKPIEELIIATRHIAKGDFKPELNINSRDELGELASAFRQMGKQLMHTSRRIRQLAYFDPLTQLPNRTTLRETLTRLLARAERSKVKSAVLFIDLDDFKKVNDRLGHEAGDKLLIQISERLKNRLRQADVLFEQAGVTSVDQLISRRGGDEFNAILSSIKAPHDAAIVAERIIQDLNEPFFISKSEIHVGASVGIAIFPDDGRDADTLLRNADLAMYEAKGRGKNNYHIFTSAINEQVHQRLALENALQMAMVQNQFCLYYQPKIDLTDMSPVGFEALIRWKHPDKGIILPGKFIPVAEESNLIRDIGHWVLGESMQQIQLWDDMLPAECRIAINISARQLSQVDLVDQLKTMMEHFEIPASRLEIELTETSVLQDEAMAIQHLSALRELGVEVSLDDFGTGYSSLSFLRKLPIDTVKIDRSFTANMIQNHEARAIVVSLLGLCRELNVKTIAEGIETTEQLQFLMEHNCEQGQGFLFSEPLPADEVIAFINEPSYIA